MKSYEYKFMMNCRAAATNKAFSRFMNAPLSSMEGYERVGACDVLTYPFSNFGLRVRDIGVLTDLCEQFKMYPPASWEEEMSKVDTRSLPERDARTYAFLVVLANHGSMKIHMDKFHPSLHGRLNLLADLGNLIAPKKVFCQE